MLDAYWKCLQLQSLERFVFWLLKRVGRPVMHQVWYWFIMAVDLWSLLLSTKETNRKAQNAWYMYAATCTQSWYRCQAFLGLKHTCSLTILGTAAAQIWLNTVYTGHAGLVLLGSPWCWQALAMFKLPLLIVPGCADTVLSYGFKLQCKCSIRHTRLMTSNAVCSCTWTRTLYNFLFC